MIYTHINEKLITKLNRTCSTKVQLILAMSVLGVLFLWEVIKNMDEKEVVTRFYNSINEEERLQEKHGQVEYITTMKYIHKYLKPKGKVLEVGAGTGRYSIALGREGYEVDAVELVEHNIDIFRGKLLPEDRVRVMQGNAMDLSMYEDESFDMVLSLGPMYHLFDVSHKRQALEETIRVTRRGGYIFTAYCMNEATLIQYCFQRETIWQDRKKGLLSEDFHWTANENDAFALMRPREIIELTENYKVRRLHMVASDGATRYMDDTVDQMSEETFQMYLKYHFSVCEREDLIGASNHVLDILQKK